MGQSADQSFHSLLAKLSGGVSPAGLMVAWTDWATHVALSPERQLEMWSSAMLLPVSKHREDRRFADALWDDPPFSFYKSAFLATQAWWQVALAPLPGVDPKHQRAVDFYARQALDMASPSNYAATNPLVAQRAFQSGGESLVDGFDNWLTDVSTTLRRKPRPAEGFEVGKDVAITPGQVVFRNRLVELLHYLPSNGASKGPPIFVVPAWIMKFYILDLSPSNSVVKYLVDQGFEVFMLSWKNPDASDVDLDLDDYLQLGIRDALTFLAAHGHNRVHAVGYCLGGTLLAIAAAAQPQGDASFASTTLLASQTDFTEPGELGIFMTEAQVAFLEDVMNERGYLEAKEMAAAFQMLRSADLIWSRVIRHYLLGERTPINDLMAWNADATRMPARMHTTYLRKLFLENGLANRSYRVDARRVSLTDIRCPVYCLATETDHVSPWRSVFKLLALTDTDVRFVLTNGGHNGGVLSEPGHRRRHFRVLAKEEGTRFVGPDAWFDRTMPTDGSWWTDWSQWLAERSAPRSAFDPLPSLGPAPGTYVLG
ncbi:MAG: alpha/beta fold hydrolase [Pseudomonadota bacterium]